MSAPTATVILAATPLGNPGDASARLRAALATVAVIAAEDTRRLRRLCSDLDVVPTGRIVSFFEANERRRVEELLDALGRGEDVLVVTDAGMPSVSDPGYRLVAAAVAGGFGVTVLPGPSAVLAALAVSGLPVARFCFEGFLPRKAGERAEALERLGDEQRSMVFFEAPHRLSETLDALVVAFGPDRPAAICRELTKTYEETVRGPLADLRIWAEREVLGEITIVVGGALASRSPEQPQLLAALVAVNEEHRGLSRKEAIARVAKDNQVPKRVVFDAMIAAKKPRAD